MQKKEYALALAGGGTRGAYEVGAYKALMEMGINIKAICGTSIGALNGAIFLSEGVDKAEKMYNKIGMSDVIDVDEEGINTDKDIFDVSNIFKLLKEYTKKKGLDNTPLKELILKEIDIQKIYKNAIDFGLVTYSIKSKKAIEAFKDSISQDDFINYIMASACFPIYKAQKIDEEEYFDGFFYDNLPINMLIKKGYKNIIAIDLGSTNSGKKLIDDKVYVKYIKSRENLGGIFEFNKDRIKFNINLGYLDTLKAFNKLKGHIYYFNSYEFNRLLHKFTLEEVYGLEYAANIYGIDKYKIYKCKDFLKQILTKHSAATKNYEKIKEKLDFKKLIKDGKDLKKIVDKCLGIPLIVDMINNKPSFKNIKIINKLFSTYILAAQAIIELEQIEKS